MKLTLKEEHVDISRIPGVRQMEVNITRRFLQPILSALPLTKDAEEDQEEEEEEESEDEKAENFTLLARRRFNEWLPPPPSAGGGRKSQENPLSAEEIQAKKTLELLTKRAML